MLKQFDIVQILDTNKIKYVSGPKGRAALPTGNWSIIGFKGVEALIARHSTVVLVPIVDIRRIAAFDIQHFFKQLKKPI